MMVIAISSLSYAAFHDAYRMERDSLKVISPILTENESKSPEPVLFLPWLFEKIPYLLVFSDVLRDWIIGWEMPVKSASLADQPRS